MKADILIESLAGNVGRDEVIRRLRHHHRDSNQVFYDLSAISDENHDEATNSVQDVMGSTSMASTSTDHGPTSDTAKHTPSAMTPLETLEEWRKTTISGHARPPKIYYIQDAKSPFQQMFGIYEKKVDLFIHPSVTLISGIRKRLQWMFGIHPESSST
ncbi:uncharacterized protein [Ptychodera flava]|uniref:uncharacterized protein n=1 Tax=Ptychodera flava TaxID=63121 RepID=UPI003969CF83